jgi:tetratricopeptide (TPR) repeat protein
LVVILRLLLALLLQAAPPPLQVPVFAAPTKTAPALTADETAAIRKGIALHDQKQYDAAIAAYQAVLDANPDNATALYEMAYSCVAKQDYQRAIDLAARGTAYRDNANFYVVIASAFEAVGDGKTAVEVYRKGTEFYPHAGTLYYNMAVTTGNQLHDPVRARQMLKDGAFADPGHAGTQLLLGREFGADGLKTLSLFALSRFLVLEPSTSRTPQAYQAWYAILNAGVSPNASGGLNLALDPKSLQPSSEGNLGQMDLFIGFSKVGELKVATGKTPAAQLAEQVTQLLKVDASQKPGNDKDTFLWTYYMPYFSEMSAKGLTEPFVYYVSQRINLPGVREWIAAHPDALQAFAAWNKAYPWPAK